VTSIGDLADPAALGSWVTGVTLNVVRRELRRRARRRWLTFSASPPEPMDTGASAEDHAILRSFYRVLASMRPDDQIVLTLRLVEGCTIPEIAVAQGISVATVKRHFSAALGRLQRRAARDFWLADVLKETEEDTHDA
jgi:RNA polymerase sigma factor (sigma-70 family)